MQDSAVGFFFPKKICFLYCEIPGKDVVGCLALCDEAEDGRGLLAGRAGQGEPGLVRVVGARPLKPRPPRAAAAETDVPVVLGVARVCGGNSNIGAGQHFVS